MISIEQWSAIRTLHQEGHGIKKIAKILNISKNTVKKALKANKIPQYVRSKTVTKKTDLFSEEIKKMYLEQKFIGTRIFHELQKKGFTGSLNGIYRCLAEIKQQALPSKVTARFETDPGKQGQFDWSPYQVVISGEKYKVICFLFILGYSRRKYMTFSLSQSVSSVLEALEEALCFFNGSPQEILFDNAKQIIIEHSKNNTSRFNKDFLILASLYRFKPHPCQPYWPRTKGKVERPFYYIEQHFIKGNEFESFEDLVARGKAFIEDWDRKTHHTTLEIPCESFKREESLLIPLPEQQYTSTIRELRKVSWDCLVSFEGTRYSVPHIYAGKNVWVRLSHAYWLQVYSEQGLLIAEHQLSKTKGASVIQPEHYQNIKNSIPKTVPRTREILAEEFPSGQEFYEALVVNTKFNAAYHGQKILELRDYYTNEIIELALKKALAYKAYEYQAVRNVLKQYPLKEDIPKIAGSPPLTKTTVRSLKYYSDLLGRR